MGSASVNTPHHCVDVAAWQETMRDINAGERVTWTQFVVCLRVNRVTTKFCTCGTYWTMGACEGSLLPLLLTVPGFRVPKEHSWKNVVCWPCKLGRVRRTVRGRVQGVLKVTTQESRRKARTKSGGSVSAPNTTHFHIQGSGNRLAHC